jgi:hypothetical protein
MGQDHLRLPIRPKPRLQHRPGAGIDLWGAAALDGGLAFAGAGVVSCEEAGHSSCLSFEKVCLDGAIGPSHFHRLTCFSEGYKRPKCRILV